ncbi:Protein LURP-one-related 15 [Bienertia sinuspersici]
MEDEHQPDQNETMSKVIVVDEDYCTTKSQKFVVKKKFTHYQTSASFDVFDDEENFLLHASGCNFAIHRTVLMTDHEHSPLVTLQEGRILDKHRWELYKGDSTDVNDYICKVQRTSAIQVKARLDVFFPNHDPKSDDGKFEIKEELSSHSAVLYKGNRAIAHVQHRNTWKSFLQGKDVLKVEVCEGVDYAFVMSILIIMIMIDIYYKI